MNNIQVRNKELSVHHNVIELKSYCMNQRNYNEETTVNSLINMIVYRINNFGYGEKFCLEDVLYDLWRILSNNIKRKLGKNFSTLVKQHKIDGVKLHLKKSNKTIYEML